VSSDTDGVGQVMEMHRESRRWSRPQRLGDRDAESAPRAVIDNRGVLTVAWASSLTSEVEVATRAPHGAWGALRHLVGFNGDDPVLAGNARGDVAVARPTATGVGVAVRRRDGSWRRPHVLHSVIDWPDEPHVVVVPTGRVLVLWSRSFEEEEHFTRRYLAWARTRLDGSWTRVHYLGTLRSLGMGTNVDLSFDGHGHALAVWAGEATRRVRVSRFRFGHGWSRPHRFNGGCCSADAHVTPAGTGIAVFDGPGGSSDTRWAYQRPGGRWHVQALRPALDPTGVYRPDLYGAGRRMAAIYYGPRLTARVMVIDPAP